MIILTDLTLRSIIIDILLEPELLKQLLNLLVQKLCCSENFLIQITRPCGRSLIEKYHVRACEIYGEIRVILGLIKISIKLDMI